MEYFEVDKKAQKKKIKKLNYSHKNIFYLIILSSLLCILFFIFSNNFAPKELKEIKIKENQNNDLNQPLNPSKDSNDYAHTEFILNLFDNYNKIDFTNFEKNIKIIVQKIYNIINNKKENEDAYILLSSIYGAFLADSMGSFCEFKPFNKNNHLEIFNSNNWHTFKPGQVTDDSEMAMSQAYAIMDNPNIYELNENLIYYYYLIWYNSHPLDIGITTRQSLNIIKLKENNYIKSNLFTEEIKQQIKEKNSASLANGLLMRISPILCWFYMVNRDYIKKILETKNSIKYYELYNKILLQIEKDSQLTHPNIENAVVGSIFIFMGLCSLEQKYSGGDILNMIEILLNNEIFNVKTEEKIVKNHYFNIITSIKKEDFKEDIYFGNLSNLMGYYLHAFKLTIYYLYNFDNMKRNMNIKEIYNKIIFNICDYGGDTDTNAAIVGMILGPLIGIKNFDNEFVKIFLNFYSKNRVLYTNAFIYYFVQYLINIDTENNHYNSIFGEKINFNFFEILYNILYKNI